MHGIYYLVFSRCFVTEQSESDIVGFKIGSWPCLVLPPLPLQNPLPGGSPPIRHSFSKLKHQCCLWKHEIIFSGWSSFKSAISFCSIHFHTWVQWHCICSDKTLTVTFCNAIQFVVFIVRYMFSQIATVLRRFVGQWWSISARQPC
jgi:hypothetical protein